jgi:hypothetical protein
MAGWLERLGVAWLGLALAGLALGTASVLLAVACRQPARRLVVARASLAGLLALPVLALAWPWRPPSLGAWADSIGPSGRATLGVLALANLAGAALGAAGQGLGVLAVGRLRARSRAASGALEALYRDLRGPRRRAPALRVSDRVRGPALLGVARPTIYVPAAWDVPERADAARLGIRHELAHHDRADAAFGLLGSLALAPWFFLPMAWWLRAQMRLDQEFLADFEASEGFGPFGAYASTLVALADPSRGGTAGPPSGRERVGAAPPLRLRVLMLVRCPFRVEVRPPGWCRGALLGLVGSATLLSAGLLGLGPASSPEAGAAALAPHGRFRVARLALDPPRLGPDGRARPYALMAQLPPRFTLTARVLATPEDLEQFRLVGQRLGPVAALPVAPRDGFHDVKITRDARSVRVWVDGFALPGADPDRIGKLVSLQPPPGQPALVRDLILTW